MVIGEIIFCGKVGVGKSAIIRWVVGASKFSLQYKPTRSSDSWVNEFLATEPDMLCTLKFWDTVGSELCTDAQEPHIIAITVDLTQSLDVIKKDIKDSYRLYANAYPNLKHRFFIVGNKAQSASPDTIAGLEAYARDLNIPCCMVDPKTNYNKNLLTQNLANMLNREDTEENSEDFSPARIALGQDNDCTRIEEQDLDADASSTEDAKGESVPCNSLQDILKRFSDALLQVPDKSQLQQDLYQIYFAISAIEHSKQFTVQEQLIIVDYLKNPEQHQNAINNLQNACRSNTKKYALLTALTVAVALIGSALLIAITGGAFGACLGAGALLLGASGLGAYGYFGKFSPSKSKQNNVAQLQNYPQLENVAAIRGIINR